MHIGNCTPCTMSCLLQSETFYNQSWINYLYLDALSSFTDNPEKAGEIFNPCFEESYENGYIPEDQREATQIFLGATAGMRLVK